MDRIGEVKKILDYFMRDNHNFYPSPKTAELAQEICQLFEPKPDQSRLLTDEERNNIVNSIPERQWGCGSCTERLVKAQDAKTASIKDAEYKQEIERELIAAWNEESIRLRNQTSTTLPMWARSALGQDTTDRRRTRLERRAKLITDKQKINEAILEQVVNAMYEAQSAKKAAWNILALTNAECQARIEALIEEIEKAYTEYIRQQFGLKVTYFPWEHLKATHTSGESIKRNTAVDPEVGQE